VLEGNAMRTQNWTIVLVMLALLAGCATSKAARVTILPVPPGASAKTAGLMAEGDRLFNTGDWTGAGQAYQAAAVQQPDLAEAHYNLAVALDRMGNKEEARKHYVTAANLAPGNKVIWDSPPFRQSGLEYNLRKKSYLDPNPRGGF
jgi:tetratricopeptide (TPR) repeat protein